MRQSVKRRMWSRVGVVAAVAVGAIGLSLAPAGATSATGIGHAGVDAACLYNFSALTTASSYSTYAVPAGGGLITSWQADSAHFGYTLQFELWRPAGGGQYTLVGRSSAPVTEAANTGVHTYPLSPPIAAQGGDVIGIWCQAGSGGGLSDGGGAYQLSPGPVPNIGDTLPFYGYGGYSLNVAATVTTGQCGPGMTAHYSSGFTGSGYDSGVWCMNAQGIGTYTQDGRIAPGRIIKVGNILWFQADGNNLRNSGYLNTANGASSFVQTKSISATGKVLTLT